MRAQRASDGGRRDAVAAADRFEAKRRSTCALQEAGRGAVPSDRPTHDRLSRAGSYLASQASPGSTHRGAGPTSANHVGRVGGPPPSDSATRTSVRPTRSAWANRETFTRLIRSVNLPMTCDDAKIRRSAGVVSSPEVHRKSHRRACRGTTRRPWFRPVSPWDLTGARRPLLWPPSPGSARRACEPRRAPPRSRRRARRRGG